MIRGRTMQSVRNATLTGVSGSLHGAARNYPWAALARHRRDAINVGVVVQDSDVEFLGGRDQEVRDLAASLTALSEQALHPKRPVLVRRGRIELKRVERAPTSTSHSSALRGRGEYPTPRPQMLARANSPAAASGSTT
jgi:hypothetical protein